jgi:hypothetical protein
MAAVDGKDREHRLCIAAKSIKKAQKELFASLLIP